MNCHYHFKILVESPFVRIDKIVGILKAVVFDFNVPAKRCYEKCGFKAEGLLRDEIYREGTYHDVTVMSLIRNTEE